VRHCGPPDLDWRAGALTDSVPYLISPVRWRSEETIRRMSELIVKKKGSGRDGQILMDLALSMCSGDASKQDWPSYLNGLGPG